MARVFVARIDSGTSSALAWRGGWCLDSIESLPRKVGAPESDLLNSRYFRCPRPTGAAKVPIVAMDSGTGLGVLARTQPSRQSACAGSPASLSAGSIVDPSAARRFRGPSKGVTPTDAVRWLGV
jgi:hypothetical protein